MRGSCHELLGVVAEFVVPLAVDLRNLPGLLVFMYFKGKATQDENVSRQKAIRKLILTSLSFLS